jgi:hypothetical protein
MTQDGEVCRGAHPRRTGSARPTRPSPGPRGFFAILAALAVVLGLRDARADHFEVSDANWMGCSEMLEIARSELGVARVRPVAVLDWSEVQPEDGVLAIHPLQPMDPDDTTSFMKAGGRLAVLIDEDGAGEETLSRFHIYRVPAPSRPVAALRNRAAFAIAEPVIDVVAGHLTGAHPVVQHVQQLVTNHPAGLRHPALSPVLRIRAIGEPDVILAVAGQVGKGRLFAMGDSSAIINQMLRYPGNRAFVTGLVHYLVDDDGAMHRQGRLFIVANRFGEEGSFGGEGSTQNELQSRLKSIAAALADARRDGFPGWAHLAAAVLAALGLALWVARASARPYRSPLPRYARPVPLVAQGGVAGRFAVLSAPSSPRSLALLELKSALYEGLAQRLGFGPEPAPDALAKMALKAGSLDGSTYSALKEILGMMHQVETAVVAGRAVRVTVRDLARAAEVVHDVLGAVNEGAHKPGAQPRSQTPPHAGDSAG